MKNINMKKVVAGVAALGVSALLAGSVVAANVGADNFSMNITKDTMYNNGVPSVSVVVGSMAQPVDVVWAGNIAAAIGKKAYTTAGTVGGAALQDVTIEVGSSSVANISGDGKLTDDWELGSSSLTEVLDEDDYSLLDDYDVSVDDDIFGDDEINVKDSISLNATVAFDDDKDVADLTATINKSAIEYVIQFTPGINEDTNDEGSPDFKFNIMGKQYTLEDYDNGTMTLVQNKATVPYTVGQTFEVEGYTVEVLEILEKSSTGTDYEVEMSISQDGSVLATEVFADGETIFNDYLDIDTEIDTVYNSRVTVVSGTSARIELKDGQIVEDFPNIGDELWKVSFDDDTVTEMTFTNDDSDVQWKNEDALRVGDSIELPNGFAKIEFLGLTTESTKTLTVGDNLLSWTDSDDDDHEIFMYEEDTSDFETGDNYTTSGELDGKKLYFDFNTTDDITQAAGSESGYFTVQLDDDDGKYLTTAGAWVSLATPTATEKFFFDGDAVDDTATNFVGWKDMIIPLYNNETEKITYGLYIKEVSGVIEQIAIGLKQGTGSDIESTTPPQTWEVGDIHYQINTDNAATTSNHYVGASAIDGAAVVDEDMVSMFELIVDDSDTKISVYIDAYTGDLVNTDDTEYDAGIKQVEANDGIKLNQEDSDDLTWAYTDFGTKYMVDGGMFEAEIPEDQLYGQIFVGGGSSSETTLNGGELVLTTPGTVVETEDGMISAKLITSTVTGGEEMTAMTPANWNASTQRIVYLDNETMTSAGAKIIVGGHLVNALANGITDEYLTEAGQYVVGAVENGNIVVAGFSAADTAEAAKELINAIEALE